jgi:hypothetical protein
MDKKPISSRMYPLVVLYDMHTGFFKKAIAGISDKDSHNRLNTKANHIAWLAGSLTEQRYDMARQFGNDQRQSTDELFKNYQGIKDEVTYPPLATFLKDWETISAVLRELLMNITDEKLDSIFEMEGMKMTYFELLSFMTYREASVIGQIALWRRLLGYEALKYD